MARHFPFCPFKRVATGEEVPFHHRCRSRQILEVRRILPDSPQTCPKSFLCNFACKFSPTKIMKTSFWCNLQNNAFMFFYANRGSHCMKSNNVGRHFYQDFQGFCPDFQQIKTFGEALATHAAPALTPLLFKQIYCRYCDWKARTASAQEVFNRRALRLFMGASHSEI